MAPAAKKPKTAAEPKKGGAAAGRSKANAAEAAAAVVPIESASTATLPPLKRSKAFRNAGAADADDGEVECITQQEPQAKEKSKKAEVEAGKPGSGLAPTPKSMAMAKTLATAPKSPGRTTSEEVRVRGSVISQMQIAGSYVCLFVFVATRFRAPQAASLWCPPGIVLDAGYRRP